MNKDTYDKINKYCMEKCNGNLTQPEKDYVLRKFFDSYYEAVEKYKEAHHAEPNIVEEQTIINSLLNESTILSYIDSAKAYYEKIVSSIESTVKKKQDKRAFWKNIGQNILANLIYAIISIVVFFVAKDQITTWLIQLGV